MTYCLAIAIDNGLVFASDSRTNAGVDNINTYPKMYTFSIPDQAYFVLLTSGNLATSQALVRHIERDLQESTPATPKGLAAYSDMSDAASYVGTLAVNTKNYYQHDLQQSANFDCTVILGGQIKGQPGEIFLIYPEGNYIQSSPYAPYLQIGETKYGKPILDRVIRHNMPLADAARCALVSLDSTMRSNLSVAPPFDLIVYEKDSLAPTHTLRYKLNSPYYASLKKRWSEGLLDLFHDLPAFDWENKKS